MEAAVKKEAKRKRYKVRFIREGERKIRHIDYAWARSAREARQIIKEKWGKSGGKIVKVKAGALG